MADSHTIERGFCRLCGRALLPPEGFGALKDGSGVCAACLRKLRPMYPLALSWDKKGNEVRQYPIRELDAAKAAESLKNAAAFIEELRARYDHHNAVFTVESVTVEKGGFMKPSVYTALGKVVYGCFEPEDRIKLLHGGSSAETVVTGIRKRASYGAGSTIDRGLGGQPCALEFTGKGLACEPGDLIVRD
ncbi:MAG: hypothetical protein IKN89_09745 [Oscillospiraceae bacterium]|nr:hypothetical protein [Oscillospiraceae bacterium]